VTYRATGNTKQRLHSVIAPLAEAVTVFFAPSFFHRIRQKTEPAMHATSTAYTHAPQLELHALSKTYPSPAAAAVPALRGVTLTVRCGEFVSILGPAGCGKSTLLNLLGCLESASSGRYFCDGQNIASLDAVGRARLRQRKFGFIFRSFHLLPRLNVLENVMLPLACSRLSRIRQRERAHAALREIGIADCASHKPTDLCNGLQQRIAIARALINDAPILLADEPTGALDATAAGEILTLLQRLREHGRTLVLMTENADVATHAGRHFFMRDGRLYAPYAAPTLSALA
jgi:putative ABC transport system ATP-binding protein